MSARPPTPTTPAWRAWRCLQIESGNFASKRAIWWMIFAGVFERHPGLKLVITETPGSWFTTTADELDGVYSWYEAKREEPLNKALFEQVPRRPSEYMAQNVFFGASFASPLEVEQAVLHGIDTQLLWGSDYPHLEGTFVYQDGPRPAVGDPAVAPQHLQQRARSRDAPHGRWQRHRRLQPRRRRPSGDRSQHRRPDIDELSTPIDAVPAGASATAFRSGAGGWS